MPRFVLFLLLASSAALSAPRVEQHVAGKATLNLALALPAPSQAGNTIIVAMGHDLAGAVCVVTDSANNPYISPSTPQPGTGTIANRRTHIQYARNIGVTARPLEFTISCGEPIVHIFELSGLDRTTTHHASVSAAGANTGFDSGSLGTPASEALLIGWIYAQNQVQSVDPAYSTISNYNNDMVVARIVNDGGQFGLTGTVDVPGWNVHLAAFRSDPTIDGGHVVMPAPDGGPGRGFVYRQSSGLATDQGLAELELQQHSQVGNTLVVCTRTAVADCAVNDDAANSYTRISGPKLGAGVLSGQYQSIWFARVDAIGPRPLEVRSECLSRTELRVAEYSGVGAFDKASTFASSLTSTTIESMGIATAADDSLLFWCADSSGDVSSLTPPMVQRLRFNGNAVADMVAPTAGFYSSTATSTSTEWISGVVAFIGLDAGTSTDGGAVVPDGGTMGADGGSVSGDGGFEPDAGDPTDGGAAPGPRTLRVGFGCGAGPGGPLGLALLLWFRRSSSGSDRRTPPGRESRTTD